MPNVSELATKRRVESVTVGANMAEEDDIMEARRQSPAAVRDLADLALTTDDAAARRAAIVQLVACQLFSNSAPADDELQAVVDTDAERIFEVLRGGIQ